MKKLCLAICLLLLVSPLLAAQVAAVRMSTEPDRTRLVFDTTDAANHKVFTLKKPDRLVIDLTNTGLAKGFKPAASLSNEYLAGLRYAVKPDGKLRLVLDLKRPMRPKTFLLKPSASHGHRLVVDLHPVGATRKPRVAKSTKDIARARDVIVAIDAGHGGKDPGARGKRYRTNEKQLTLQIARRVKRLIDAEPGMHGVLTRTGDYSMPLRKRMLTARKHKADLFLSIHADAFHDKRVRGSSVYVLSRRGASSEAARWLAERENSSDLAGGVKLEDKDPLLASVLLSLSQSATQHSSLNAASKVFKELKTVGKTHGRRVQNARFVVLKSPDIPSMLIETGYISNPEEERKLRDPAHQNRLAKAIVRGVKRFFEETPPPGTLLAERKKTPVKHVIARGDTLSEIADRYQVSMAMLRSTNAIRRDNLIRVGQVLVIPES